MSGRKNNLRQFNNLVNGDMSQATIESAITNIQFLDAIAVQLNFTGTPTGSFEIQVSVDYAQDDQGNVTNPGNWIAMTLDPAPIASGVAGNIFIDIRSTSAPWMKVVYIRTSGSGTLNSYISAKQL